MVFPAFCFAGRIQTYFSDYTPAVVWETNPPYMVDGYLESYATTTTNRREQVVKTPLLSDEIIETEITKVEISGCGLISSGDIILEPSTGGSYAWTPIPFLDCSAWYDITGVVDWDWTQIRILNVKLYPSVGFPFEADVSMVRLRITHESKSEFVENTSTGASFYIDKNISYGDFLSVFFCPSYWSCFLSK